MKKSKRYFIIPAVCIAVLVAIIVSVALFMNNRFFKRVSYDHIDTNAYNGVEIIGEDGKFYLSRDGKKISKGYAYLRSVNDLYTQKVLSELAESNKPVVLFDYYIATSSEDTSICMLITSSGEEYIISGEGYTLDTSRSKLPYLAYTNNKSGLVGVVSLQRLDSDISYKSGKELTLRSFTDISVKYTDSDDALGSYLVTEDVADSDGTVKSSYFRNDGIKLTTGSSVETIALSKKNEQKNYLYFYNPSDRNIVSVTGELIASDINDVIEASYDWGYAECTSPSTNSQYIVVFSPDRAFTLTDASYDLSSMWKTFDRAIILEAADSQGFDIINVTTAKTTRYQKIEWVNGGIVRATNNDGQYYYLDGDGAVLMKSESADMTLDSNLSSDTCYVLYEAANTGKKYFTRAGSEPYIFDNAQVSVAKLENTFIYDTYTVSKLDGVDIKYALLAPFSALKMSDYYNSVECSVNNSVAWVKASSIERSTLDILDPLTLKVVSGFHLAAEDFGDYSLKSAYDHTLYTDKRNDDTEVNINVVTLTRSSTDSLKNSVRYFALYRSAHYLSDSFYTAPLQANEFDSDLLLDNPMTGFEKNNYLVTHSPSGSKIYSFDSNLELVNTANIPYPVHNLIQDAVTKENYFTVRSSYEANAKFGVYNAKGECLLSPYYGAVNAAADSRFAVVLRGAYGIVKAKPNGATKTIVDFEHPYIQHLCGDAFVAAKNDTQIDIYRGKRIILSGIVTSVNDINYYTVAEDGSLTRNYGAIVNIEGKSYIHR